MSSTEANNLFENTFLCKLPKSPTEIEAETYTFYSKWQSDIINIKIIDSTNEKQWTGTLKIEAIKESAKDLEIPYEKFLSECQKALTQTGGIENFTYIITTTTTTSNRKFMLQKNDKFKITYLEINLENSVENLQTFFLNESIAIIHSLRSNYEYVAGRSEARRQSLEEIGTEYKKCVIEMNALEKTLLSKFVIILNAKKGKVVELQAVIKAQNKILSRLNLNKENTNGLANSNGYHDDDDTTSDEDNGDGSHSPSVFDLITQREPSDFASSNQPKIINLPRRKNLSNDVNTISLPLIPSNSNHNNHDVVPVPIAMDVDPENSNNNDKNTEHLFENM